MLCNEGHRQALQARKERDKTSKRLLNIQYLHKFQSVNDLEFLQLIFLRIHLHRTFSYQVFLHNSSNVIHRIYLITNFDHDHFRI